MKIDSLNNRYYSVKCIDNNKPYLDYTLEIDWNIKNIIDTDCKDGYVVQKVEIVDNTYISRNIIYYEAWKVENEKYVNHSDLKADDTFSNSNILDSLGKKGTVEYSSEIYWIDKNNSLYEYIDNWKEGTVPEAGNLKSALYEDCDYLHSYKFVYKREEFIHQVNFTDRKVILENFKSHFKKRRDVKTEEFYSYLKENLQDHYSWIEEEIQKDWENTN